MGNLIDFFPLPLHFWGLVGGGGGVIIDELSGVVGARASRFGGRRPGVDLAVGCCVLLHACMYDTRVRPWMIGRSQILEAWGLPP